MLKLIACLCVACPDGVLPVNCLVNPCQVSTCEGIPGALCVANYCGGCHDRWYVGDLEVTDQCGRCTCIILNKSVNKSKSMFSVCIIVL